LCGSEAGLSRHKDNDQRDQEAKGRHAPKRAVEHPDALPSENASERRARAFGQRGTLVRALQMAIVRRYGDDAMLKAAERADQQLDLGDMAGAETWDRILNAIERLQVKGAGGWGEGELEWRRKIRNQDRSSVLIASIRHYSNESRSSRRRGAGR